MQQPVSKKQDMSVLMKTLLDLGPLAAFMIADQMANIFVATGVLMVAVIIAFIITWVMARRIALFPVITLGFILIFGGLTLLFDDETFIKLEVTISYGLTGLFLLGGLAFGRSLLQLVFGGIVELADAGWRIVTWRMGVFLVAVAGLNEVVWRSVSTDNWVWFRGLGILGLSVLFLISQVPTVMRYIKDDEQASESD